jgi:hypothetical protein
MNRVHPPDVPPAGAELLAFRLLLVEPQATPRALLQRAATPVARVVSHADFPTAREYLEDGLPFDFLVTNVRLGAFNGLHLVYVAAAKGLPARSIVYTDQPEVGLASEAHRAGAFYETGECLRVTLTGYLRGTLPPYDRRKPSAEAHHTLVPGGRRCWDRHLAAVSRLSGAAQPGFSAFARSG